MLYPLLIESLLSSPLQESHPINLLVLLIATTKRTVETPAPIAASAMAMSKACSLKKRKVSTKLKAAKTMAAFKRSFISMAIRAVITKIIRKSIVALEDINPGALLTNENSGIRRPGNGLSPKHYYKIIGRRAKKKINNGEYIRYEDVS